jgi:ABC-type bacteriocin/lantibiotic exporter with double-glycine peptidase domain
VAAIILSVPHIPQREQGECLTACAAMMLRYMGHPVNYDHLMKLL